MTKTNMRVVADNLAEAAVEGGDYMVSVKVDPEFLWDASGLLRFSAMLKGAALVLMAGNVTDKLVALYLVWDILTPASGLIQYSI